MNPSDLPLDAAHDADKLIVPVIAEELQVETRLVETGLVRLQKTVQEREETIDEPLLRQEVVVDRVEVNRLCEGETPGVRYEGDTMIVPVLEEVLVVEKRLMLKEEIYVRQVQSTFHAPQRMTLRREEVEVERVTTSEEPETSPT